MTITDSAFFERAAESLAGAESEFSNGRYNNAANRAYYASFQAAIAALQDAGVRAPSGEWRHAFVPAQFDGILVNRRKLYPPEIRGTLNRNAGLRFSADYDENGAVTRTEAERALRRTRLFLQVLKMGGRGR